MLRMLCLIFLFGVIPSMGIARETIIVGSKGFSESIILEKMLKQLLIEKYDQKVDSKSSLGGTKVAFDAIKHGAIDIYPEYTGTAFQMILKLKGESHPERVHKLVSEEYLNRWGIIWSRPLGFNNTYTIAVRKSDPQFRNISKISQLKALAKNLRYLAPYEFMEREDGHRRFVKTYSLEFDPDKIISMQAGLAYAAIRDDKADLIVAYSTDGRIKAYDLKLLQDDLHYFPPYYAAFNVRQEALTKFPALKNAIEDLEGLIDENEMVHLNDRVDRLKQSPELVAHNFLVQKGLLEGKVVSSKKHTGFFAFMLSKKKYLWELLLEHLQLCLFSLALAFVVSLPTGIALTRHEALGKVVFPVINTIQTIPSLALLGFFIPIMGIGPLPAMCALFLYSLLPLVRNTYTGIIGVDKRFVEASKGIGLSDFQILMKVEIPLAMPVILAGLRTAAVIVIGTATIAALIGAGGFGDPIFRGVATVNSNLILLGAVPAALLAIIVDKLIGVSEKYLVSKGLRLSKGS